MTTTNPKAFICHASEDKARFVTPFSTALRANGVDAWVDQFEILAGDSIVQKIFNQGIENAKAVIAVISAVSVTKPWVQTEIDVAFVRRIEGKCKLIPIILDGAPPPTCLSALRWESVSDPTNFEAALHNVVLSLFDQYEKPPLGSTPAFVTTPIGVIPGISILDSKVLISCCQLSEKMDRAYSLDGQLLIPLAAELQLSTIAFCESLEVLHQKGLVEIDKINSGDITGCRPTISGYDLFLRATDPDYVPHFIKIISRIANNGDITGKQLVEASKLSPRTMYHFVKHLALNGHILLIENIQYGCIQLKITRVHSTTHRLLESLTGGR